jgi:hypothetical protein
LGRAHRWKGGMWGRGERRLEWWERGSGGLHGDEQGRGWGFGEVSGVQDERRRGMKEKGELVCAGRRGG